MHLIFVYGTLKRGHPNHATLAGADFISSATTIERFPLLIQGRWFSPVLLPEPGCGERVRGELWTIDAAMLARLDTLESVGLPTGYTRAAIDVAAETGAAISGVWTYFKARDRIGPVHSEPLAEYTDDRYIPAWRRG